MKGISTIIASIILVVITIGLISVAYLYMSGLISGTTGKNIQLMDSYCDNDGTNGNITVMVKNIGTLSITNLTYFIDGKTATLVDKTCDDVISPQDTVICIMNGTTDGKKTSLGLHQIRVISSTSVGGPVPC